MQMSMRRIAQSAGVSIATVSRVISAHASVSASAAESVRRAMREMNINPSALRGLRRRGARGNGNHKGTSIAFLVLGTSGSQPAPAFEQLLGGVTDAAREHELELTFSFVSDPSHLPSHLAQRNFAGAILHGERPTGQLEDRIRRAATVWVMANRHRPDYGDQVMPNNTGVGVLAAEHLLLRGHRRLAYLSCTNGSWFMGVRWLGFSAIAAEAGASAVMIEEREEICQDLWRHDGVAAAADKLVSRLLALNPMPTGIFVAEDRLLPVIDAALIRHGADARQFTGLDIVSCNNERPHLIGLHVAPTTIDIRAESIGRLAVEQLLWRMQYIDFPDRVRLMVEPLLIAPQKVNGFHFNELSKSSNGEHALA
jgi:DNA-binding LacI/PurR family transcriptional regulator